MDAEQPRMPVNFMTGLRHYVNIEKTENRLKQLLTDFKFTSVSDLIRSEGLLV
jgi:hypothetical protein